MKRSPKRGPWRVLVPLLALLGSAYLFWALPRQWEGVPVRVEFEGSVE